MKKQLLIALTAAGALASCSNEEEVYTGAQQEIVLGGVSQKATRAAIDGPNLTIDGLAKTDEKDYLPMWAWAVHHGTSSTLLFQDLKYTYDASLSVWRSAGTKYYYPIGADAGTMDFMAYSTNVDEANFTVSNQNTSTDWSKLSTGAKLYDVTFADGALDGTKEFLYTNPEWDVDCPPSSDPTLAFKHSQAYIYFIIKSGSAETKAALTLKEVKLNNVSLTGKATVEYVASTPGATLLKWSDMPAKANYTVPGMSYSPAVAPGTGASSSDAALEGGILIIPQEKKGAGFTIDYVIKQDEYTENDLEYTYTVPTTDKTSWEAGKKYIYEITIGLKEIVFKASVDNYVTEEYTVTVPGGTVTKKKPVEP